MERLAGLIRWELHLFQSISQLLPLHGHVEMLKQVAREGGSPGPRAVNPCEQPPWAGFVPGYGAWLGRRAEPTDLAALWGPAGLNHKE